MIENFLVYEGQIWTVTSIKVKIRYKYRRYENYSKRNYKEISGDNAVYNSIMLKPILKNSILGKNDFGNIIRIFLFK